MVSATKLERKKGRTGPVVGIVPTSRTMPAQALGLQPQSQEGVDAAVALQAPNAVEIAGAIDALMVGVLLLEADGRLVYSNSWVSALIRRRDGLFVDGAGVLRCRDRAAQLRLETLLSALRSVALDHRRTNLGILTISRSGRTPMAALANAVVRPLRTNQKEQEQTTGRLLLVLRDPEDCLRGCDARIADIFGLTRSESQVVGQLAMGVDIKQIADRRGVSLTTVRNQVKSVQSKTGTSRQSALVSLMLRTVLF